MRRPRPARWGLAALAIVAASCGGCSAVPNIDAAAERATYDAVAPEYLEYVEADPGLDEAAKQNRRSTVKTWNDRIAAWEQEVAPR